MRKLLVVVDMQNDFITGALANIEGQKIVDKIADYIKIFNGDVVATRDTHKDNYLETQEGKKLPVPHCIYRTDGWQIVPEIEKAILERTHYIHINKPSFGSVELAEFVRDECYSDVELVGVCTDICVISNAMIIKAFAPEANIMVLKNLCAGVTPESHETALKAMQACQINIV